MLETDNPHRVVPLSLAREILRVDYRILRKAVEAGHVRVTRKNVWGVTVLLAPIEEWERGVREYRKAKGEVIPEEGLLTPAQAGKRLGVSGQTMKRVVWEGLMPNLRRGPRGAYYATLAEWKEGLRRWRELHPVRKRKREVEDRDVSRVRVTPEVLERRRRELAVRRKEFRAFVLAVKLGLPLPSRFVPHDSDVSALTEVV